METVKECQEWCECCWKCYETYMLNTSKIFPNCPFIISLSQIEMQNMDKPFTNENYIILHDDRKYSYSFDNLPNEDRFKLSNDLKIYRKNGNPITLKRILEEMSSSPFYNSELIMQDNRKVLEDFDKKSNIIYEPYFSF